MEWSHLKTVLAVARGGSLTGAAHILSTDQTTIGRRLTAIESDLGVALFVRSKAGFLPTDDGTQVIELAERMEREIDAMLDHLGDPSAGAEGVVRLMANTWMLRRLAEVGLSDLLQANPGLTIRMSGRLPPTPLHGEATISLWFDAQARPPDRAVPFARIPYGVFHASHAPPKDNHWVMFQDDDATGPSFTRQVRKRLGKDAIMNMTATDASILTAAIQGGIGRGHLPDCIGLTTPGLVRSQSAAPPMDRVLHIHANPNLMSTKRISTVLSWLERNVADALYGEVLSSYRKASTDQQSG